MHEQMPNPFDQVIAMHSLSPSLTRERYTRYPLRELTDGSPGECACDGPDDWGIIIPQCQSRPALMFQQRQHKARP